MGIPGLLPFVHKAIHKGNASQFGGKRIIFDVSCLLHKGIFACAEKVINGEQTEIYINYIRKHLDIFLRLNCHIILVFDGQPLPAKKEINENRRASREKNQLLGKQLLKEGLIPEAYRAFQSGVILTKEIVMNTIRAFNTEKNIDIIVAPYESDAQIAYLIEQRLADAVVTEDSDLIAFGCETIIFKLEQGGECLVYERRHLSNCVSPLLSKRFEFSTFRRICIMAGCDYLPGGIQGIGLKKAEEVFTKTMKTDLKEILPRLPIYISNLRSKRIDDSFVRGFINAENVFLHQVVFDPIDREQRPLNPYPCGEDATKYAFAGKIIPPSEATRLALGNSDLSIPATHDSFILPFVIPTSSIWCTRHRKFLSERSSKASVVLVEKQNTPNSIKRQFQLINNPELHEYNDNESKKRRHSSYHPQPCNLKNGTTVSWDAKEWYRKYSTVDLPEESLSQSDNASASTKSSGYQSQNSTTSLDENFSSDSDAQSTSQCSNSGQKYDESIHSTQILNRTQKLSKSEILLPSSSQSSIQSKFRPQRIRIPSSTELITINHKKKNTEESNSRRSQETIINSIVKSEPVTVSARKARITLRRVPIDEMPITEFKTNLTFEYNAYKPLGLSKASSKYL